MNDNRGSCEVTVSLIEYLNVLTRTPLKFRNEVTAVALAGGPWAVNSICGTPTGIPGMSQCFVSTLVES